MDSTNVRNSLQALTTWSQSNRDSYPLPSELDTDGSTLAGPASEKDTTGNILSVLIFNGMATPQVLVSAAESNTAQVQRLDTYEYTTPAAAANPAKALWDPQFRGTPDDPVRGASSSRLGHQSFAHVLPFGNRRTQWTNSANANQPVFGNRGPTYAANDAGASSSKWVLLPGPLGVDSNTLLIHGGRRTWEGNIGYNDIHVTFETKPTPSGLEVALAAPLAKGRSPAKTAPDNLFVNESDEFEGDGTTGGVDKGVNAYLRPISSVTGADSNLRINTWRD